MHGRSLGAGVAVAIALMAGAAIAMFARLPKAPVKRLLTNIERELEDAPKDPHLLYLAGRTHALAYAQGEDAQARTRPAYEESGTPELPTFGTRKYDLLRFNGEADAARRGHLRDGIRLLRRAAEFASAPDDPRERDERPLLHLGLAWLLDDGSRFAPQLGHLLDPAPKSDLDAAERTRIDALVTSLAAEKRSESDRAFDALRADLGRAWPLLVARRESDDSAIRERVAHLLTRWWQDQALEAYRAAYDLAKDGDVRKGVSNFHGTFTISREAGKAILRLLDGCAQTEATEAERKRIEDHLRALDGRGFAITPVIFPVARPVPLADLLPAGRTARFDLVGDGISRLWPWPSADAAFLVWLPSPDAGVPSGRRLFGSRTWWIFWLDGYEPLSMLDDNADGRLAREELDGIGVWRDLDGDGVSAPDEVTTAADFGVRWIAVAATRTEDGVPATDAGIGLSDGSTRPTYDWTPTSLPEPEPRR